MNELFYGNQAPVVETSKSKVQPVGTAQNISNSNSLPKAQENLANGVYNAEACT